MTSKLNIDKLDLQIIQALMNNADISYADLGKQLFVYAILGFALTEAIALFGLMISFLILFAF